MALRRRLAWGIGLTSVGLLLTLAACSSEDETTQTTSGNGGSGATGTAGSGGATGGGDTGGSDTGGGGAGGGGECAVSGVFSITYAGEELANGQSYNFPMNATVQQGNSVAIFSEQKDGFTITNEGTMDLEIVSATITPDEGTMAEEMQVCSYESAVNECLPYELPTIPAGETSDLYLHFFPVASDARGGTLEIEFEYDGQTCTHTLDLGGWGRIGDDTNPAYFSTSGSETFHKLWGGYAAGQDESPGALAADPSGNVYAIGVTDALDPNRDIYIVKINADGTLGWQKLYQSVLRDDIRPTADNGGLVPADTMVYDNGFLYIVGRSNYGASSVWTGVLMKIDAADGSLEWLRYWVPNVTRAGSADDPNLMAVDVDGDTVYVTGETMDALNYAQTRQGIGVLAFDAANGNQRWAKLLIPQNYQAKHRGHSIRAAGSGVLYVAGLDNSGSPKGPFVARLSGADATGNNLVLDWARTVSGEVMGSNFNSMDIDASGNAYLSLEVTGASCKVKFVKATSTGTLTGVALADDGTNSWNKSFVARVAGDNLYVGGRVGVAGWDTQKGDGLLASLNPTDMTVNWSSIYYNGTGANEVCAHSVHGMAVNGTDLIAMGQVFTGNLNYYRYWGYWYDDPTEAVAWSPPNSDTTSTSVIIDLPGAGLLDPSAVDFPVDGAVIDVPAGLNIEYQDAVDKNETTNGAATDGDVFITKIALE